MSHYNFRRRVNLEFDVITESGLYVKPVFSDG
jgi:hypothetical protein